MKNSIAQDILSEEKLRIEDSNFQIEQKILDEANRLITKTQQERALIDLTYNKMYTVKKNLHKKVFDHTKAEIVKEINNKLNTIREEGRFIQYDRLPIFDLVHRLKQSLTSSPDERTKERISQQLTATLNNWACKCRFEELSPKLLEKVGFSLDRIIETKVDLEQFRLLTNKMLNEKWYRIFIELIANEGTSLKDGSVIKNFEKHLNRLSGQKKEYQDELKLFSMWKAEQEYIYLDNKFKDNEIKWKYGRDVLKLHYQYFPNLCYLIVSKNYDVTQLSKDKMKVLISRYVDIYKEVFYNQLKSESSKKNRDNARLRKPKSTKKAERDVQIIQLLDKGKTVLEISRALDCSRGTVYSCLERMGRRP